MAVGRDYFGSYRLVRLIRVGHTCQIWESIDERNDRRCALKSLQKEHLHKRQEFAYLKHEYEVGKELKHKNVIDTYDLVTDYDLPFLVLEFFQSQNLKQMERQDAERLKQMAPAIIEQSAQGLAYLHRRGWIHRDVKPDNFLVNDEGLVKLIDFAIAYQPPKGLGKLFGGRTKVQGTRSYMSPEQIRGSAVDQRTDVYSFGCVLFEMASGKLPFTATSPNELLQKHLTSPVPVLSAANRTVTSEFSELVGNMMAKKPDARPPSIDEFLRQYEKIRPFKSERRA